MKSNGYIPPDDVDIDEVDEEDGYLPLSPNAVRTCLVIAGGICMAFGVGYLSSPGMGFLFIGLVCVMAAVLGRGGPE